MIKFLFNNTKSIFLGLVLFSFMSVLAHPMPNSIIALNVHSKSIRCELQLPLKELQFAVPFDVTKNTNDLLKNHEQDLSKYILSHFTITGNNGKKWNMEIAKMKISRSEQEATGKYEELIIYLTINPKSIQNVRKFTINYDAIIHQVVTHRILVTIKQDWENGQIGENNSEIGIISIDLNTNTVLPFKVNLAKGSSWKGFKSMVSLGMKHISEGTDHLLFLLVLLLSAPLVTDGKKWIGSGGTKYSLIRILKIATAFTIGHSITLIMGSFGLINANAKLVELFIALSILFTAVHAIKPIFANKEIYIASVFGLLHGLAFATILTDLNLETNKLVLSLLGFNIGIELMQLFVILLVMPWLLLLSSYKVYNWVRIIGALLAGIISISWLLERYTEKSNFISIYLQNSAQYSIWIVFILACFTILYISTRKVLKK
ncbi:HupE/UreJ family protein [Flavobacterium restrictum]|uniref:HupE/UreJ family protein n=1 Tax=Flavobacterium restrictum TaxID=2594428 RepID=A0A553DRT1_9FLAO|nr:HupE/UreJ family protein [Flavobacterium restrictum]TRX35403.1 HupE/UreJ family protein [Flavobacterium restrictum]